MFKCLDPRIYILNYGDDFAATISFQGRAVYFEDAGYDPDNQLLEPIGNFNYSYSKYNESHADFSFKPDHTYYVLVEESLIRIHVYRFFAAGDYSEKLGMYVSYVPSRTDRFLNLTKPWYCISTFNTCDE